MSFIPISDVHTGHLFLERFKYKIGSFVLPVNHRSMVSSATWWMIVKITMADFHFLSSCG